MYSLFELDTHVDSKCDLFEKNPARFVQVLSAVDYMRILKLYPRLHRQSHKGKTYRNHSETSGTPLGAAPTLNTAIPVLCCPVGTCQAA